MNDTFTHAYLVKQINLTTGDEKYLRIDDHETIAAKWVTKKNASAFSIGTAFALAQGFSGFSPGTDTYRVVRK